MLVALPDDWEHAKTVSEIVKNAVEALAIIGGLIGLWKWLAERRDRATDILLKLESEFCKPEIMKGRLCIEDDERYSLIKSRLKQQVDAPQGKRSNENESADKIDGNSIQDNVSEDCHAIDAMLRFYVVLCGVRQANQVPEDSLSTCFRFWLGHYHCSTRKEFKDYVDAFFPTLRKWLADDAERRYARRFFRPGEFGWSDI